ncbi:MAG TPA: helix-turn-helix domain-containing protein [Deinococcales bacterium]|nr:helix-turn-helix domain-containing protein [Deinococcales bacterium]
MEFLDAMAQQYQRVGRPPLEGRFAGLLLLQPEPISLTEAARALGVSKATLSPLANAMLERGDVKREGRYSTREHLYSLVDDAYIRDLKEHLDASRRIAEAARHMASSPLVQDLTVLKRLNHHAGVHAQAALSLDVVLAPEERLRAADLQAHHDDNWDAIPASEAS